MLVEFVIGSLPFEGFFSWSPSFLQKEPIKILSRTHDQVSNEFLKAPGCLVHFFPLYFKLIRNSNCNRHFSQIQEYDRCRS